MRMVVRLALFSSCLIPRLCAETPQALLEETAENYRQMDGYELSGHVLVSFPNGATKLRVALAIAVIPGTHAEGEQFGKIETIKANPAVPGTPFPPIVFPAVFGHFDRLATNVASAKQTGTEALSFNGEPLECQIVSVRYKPVQDGPRRPETVTYWISPAKSLVLQTRTEYPADPHAVGPAAIWLATIESGKMSRVPAPWMLDLINQPEFVSRKEWIGKAAPNFQLKGRQGQSFSISASRGRVILLNFWSTTCGPCKAEMPAIEALSTKYAASGLSVRGISLDTTADADAWLTKNHRSLQNLADSDFTVVNQYKVIGVPTLVLIGRDGRVEAFWVGTPPPEQLDAAIRASLNSGRNL